MKRSIGPSGRGVIATTLTAMAMLVAPLGVTACSGSKPPTPVAAAEPAGGPDAGATEGAIDPSSESTLPPREAKAIARTLAQVSEIRGFSANRTVPGIKLDREQLVARVKDKALREFPAEVLQREGQVLQLFGFAPPTFNYMNEMMSLLEAQLEGFYDPKNGTMYLAADLRGKEAQATLAHELVHALQDQRWDLKKRSTYRPGKSDESLALACLAEGDATSVMMDFIMRDQGRSALDLPDEMLRELMESGANGATIQNVPRILRTTLIAPYVYGLSFVHVLRHKGGWAMVDRAWDRPPTTTEQILHPDKWEAEEAPLAVSAPTAKTLGAEWKKADEDTFGELAFAIAFEEWLDVPDARLAASGWGGDRSAIYVKGNELAFAVRSRYDQQPFAERAMRTLSAGLKKKFGKAAIDTPTLLCFERSDLGPFALARKGDELLIAIGPAGVTNAVWSSAATCPQTKAWTDEILAAR